MPFRTLSILALAAALLAAAPAGAGERPYGKAIQRSDDVEVIEVPLDHGRIRIRDLLEQVCLAAGVDPGERFATVDWSIDVGSFLGRLELTVVERLVPGAIRTRVLDDRLVIEVDRARLAASAGELIGRFEQWAGDAGGGGPPRAVGITAVTADDPRAPLAALPPGTAGAVVLVHGLDDPGWVWRDLAPALLAEGVTVLRFEYPDDQPIADSADLLAVDLAGLRDRGIERVSIVGHSMGGLVARDVLTRAAYYGGDGLGGERYPAVDRLVMLGTPNHGTPVARLRGVTEILSRVLSGKRSWRRSLDGGAGEAARDVLPGSDFLRRLNDRPGPRHTEYTIVAGRMSPIGEDELQGLVEWIESAAEAAGYDASGAEHLRGLVAAAVRGLGDGIVSIESARLDGVDDTVIVEANHLGMVVNVFESESTPPAIPIVLERIAGSPSP